MFALLLAPALSHGSWCIFWQFHTTPQPRALMLATLLVVVLMLLVPRNADESKRSVVARRRWQIGAAASLVAALALGSSALNMAAMVSALLTTATVIAALLPWLHQRLPHAWDGLAMQRKGTALLWALVALLAIVQHTRLGVFMADAAQPSYSIVPGIDELERHSCLTAYVRGAELIHRGAPNVYHAAHWPDHDPLNSPLPEDANHFAPFSLDTYGYPPHFLVLPSTWLAAGLDFRTTRTLWWVFNVLFLALGLGLVVSTLTSERARSRALLLVPVLVLSFPIVFTLQVGNVHLAAMIMAMFAWLAFEREHPALGGALLAAVIVTKISPGLLVIVLFLQKNIRAVGWTAFFGVVWTGVAWAVVGTAPFEAFFSYHMPRLSSGEAFDFLDDDIFSIAANMAPFALPFKLEALGFNAGGWETARIISWLYTVVVVSAAAFVGLKRKTTPRERAMLWLAILTLGALRSPLASPQVMFTALWMLMLMAHDVRTTRGAVGLGVTWVLISSPVPAHFEVFAVSASIFAMALQLGLLGWVVFKGPTSHLRELDVRVHHE